MATFEEFLAQLGSGRATSSTPSGQPPATFEDFLASTSRPGWFSRFGSQALGRTEDIANFFLPKPWEVDLAAPENLPEAQGFGEKAADFLGSAAPDVAIGLATAPLAGGLAAGLGVGRIASPILRGGAQAAVHSGVLAPLEYGTRDPASATVATVGGPLAALGIGALAKGAGRLLGRGAVETVQDTDLLSLMKLRQARAIAEGGTPYPTTPVKSAGEFTPRPPPVVSPEPPPRVPIWETSPGSTVEIAPRIKSIGEFTPRASFREAAASQFTPEDAVEVVATPSPTLPIASVETRIGAAKLSRQFSKSRNPSDFAHALWGRTDKFAGTDAEAAIAEYASPGATALTREHLRRMSVKALQNKADEDGMLTLYRGITGSEDATPTLSMSLSRQTAQDLSAQGDEVIEAKVPLSEVLFYGGAFKRRNAYAYETEVIVPTVSLPSAEGGVGLAQYSDVEKVAEQIRIMAKEAYDASPPTQPLSALRNQAKIMQAAAEGRPVQTRQLIESGDPVVAKISWRSANQIRDVAIKRLMANGMAEQEARAFGQEIWNIAGRMNPKTNKQLVEFVQDGTPQAAERLLNLLKSAGGVCPI